VNGGGVEGSCDSDAVDVRASVDAIFDDVVSTPETCRDHLRLKSQLLEIIGDGIIVHTLDGRIIYANERAAGMLGYSPSDLGDLHPWSWIAPEHRDHLPSRIEQIRAANGLVFEYRCIGRDGPTPPLEIHSRVVFAEPWGEIVVSVSRDIGKRSAEQEAMRRLAFYDRLTGLSNRVMLETRIESALRGALSENSIVGLIYMDLDDFKPVNDTHGHTMGDRVLRIIGERMLNSVRETDTVARVGGDEFIALFPRLSSRRELAAKARSLAECIAQPIVIEGTSVRVSVSVGLATYRSGEHHDELITRADHAMYHAKLHGHAGWAEFLESA
jgi:diguanylate cyclase (GGDEF)-like protein/PAS domain S-box-containing protein